MVSSLFGRNLAMGQCNKTVWWIKEGDRKRKQEQKELTTIINKSGKIICEKAEELAKRWS